MLQDLMKTGIKILSLLHLLEQHLQAGCKALVLLCIVSRATAYGNPRTSSFCSKYFHSLQYLPNAMPGIRIGLLCFHTGMLREGKYAAYHEKACKDTEKEESASLRPLEFTHVMIDEAGQVSIHLGSEFMRISTTILVSLVLSFYGHTCRYITSSTRTAVFNTYGEA